MSYARVKYLGTALPIDATTENLFSTVVAAPDTPNFLASADIHRVVVRLKNDQAGTLKTYRSSDRGTNWSQVSQTSVAAAASTASNDYDFLVEGYRDFKIDWLNGGVTQTTFAPDISLISDRAAAV